MYQVNETEARREHRPGPPEGSENVPLRVAGRSGRPDRRLRVVRVPGGFAFVEDEPATDRVRAINQLDEPET